MSSDKHYHGAKAALLDMVWCKTCTAEHIATIPVVTFACAHCGFGAWAVEIADSHARTYREHIVYPLHHQTTDLGGAA